jgi:hypothetical protein
MADFGSIRPRGRDRVQDVVHGRILSILCIHDRVWGSVLEHQSKEGFAIVNEESCRRV